MLRSILVPLDGSAFSAQALPVAAALAERHGAAMRLVAVYTPLAFTLSAPNAPLYDTAFDDQQREALRRMLEAYADALRSERRLETTVAVVDGDPAEVVADEAGNGRADLIAMATHGRGGLARSWLGSVADELVRRTPIPLLLVRPEGAASDSGRDSRGSEGFRRVLVPLDGSALAEAIVGPALELGSVAKASYVLLRVVRVPYTVLPAGETYWTPHEEATIAAERERAGAYLANVAERVRAAGGAEEQVVVVHHDPARAILAEAIARQADLVALATHGRSGLARVRLGSVADKVVRAAPCPVLVVRPTAALA